MVPVHQQADAALRQIHGILMGLQAQLIGPAEEWQDPQLPPAIDRLVGALRGLLALVETVRDPASQTVGADGFAVTALVGALHTDMAAPRPAAPIPSHARSSAA
ncbi:hypothetical protein CXG81DRAFT_23284 [Caulochytrium protostelioides]|uniref:Uncharacterized protein n=1 Tax=Caulochytrium protostelioides TaxID=1555241 RepID=A0A4P9XEN7_9FUNG|nr:hypothetical protein CXG81DRAFT_23284 [Caulochytrium protostelioides]|eukprot:RKP04026.1 hypothetical protein CXG81DRAFT_23284 [Caulochytrium protostelioides]